MTLKTQLSIDAVKVYLNSDEFAETITYTPKNGSPKSIKAVVIRGRLGAGGEDAGRILRNQCEVYIANDTTDGVTSVDKGDDKLDFPKLAGGVSVTWVVEDILSMDEGIWRLLVGK